MKVYLYFTVALLISTIAVDASLKDVCKQALEGQNDVSYVDFCVSSLQADPKSRNANTKGLALISSNLAKANLTHNQAMIEQLLNGKSLPENSKKALRDCKELYSDSDEDVNQVINALKSNDKFTAQTVLSSLLTNIGTCLTSFEEVKAKPVMVKENNDATRICTVSLAITNLL